jgi:hypothetical protein
VNLALPDFPGERADSTVSTQLTLYISSSFLCPRLSGYGPVITCATGFRRDSTTVTEVAGTNHTILNSTNVGTAVPISVQFELFDTLYRYQ